MRTMLKGLIGAALASAMLLSLPAAAGADDQGRERRDARRLRELQSDLREAGDREAQLLEQAQHLRRPPPNTSNTHGVTSWPLILASAYFAVTSTISTMCTIS